MFSKEELDKMERREILRNEFAKMDMDMRYAYFRMKHAEAFGTNEEREHWRTQTRRLTHESSEILLILLAT